MSPDIKAILDQAPEVAQVLIPILDRLSLDIARAMLDAYAAGRKEGMHVAREVALSAFKGPTTEELLKAGKAANQ